MLPRSPPVTAVTSGGITINLLFDAAAMAAPASFRSGVQQAVSILGASISDPITVNLKIDYSGTGGGAAAGPDNGLYQSYSAIRADLINHATRRQPAFDDLVSRYMYRYSPGQKNELQEAYNRYAARTGAQPAGFFSAQPVVVPGNRPAQAPDTLPPLRVSRFWHPFDLGRNISPVASARRPDGPIHSIGRLCLSRSRPSLLRPTRIGLISRPRDVTLISRRSSRPRGCRCGDRTRGVIRAGRGRRRRAGGGDDRRLAVTHRPTP